MRYETLVIIAAGLTVCGSMAIAAYSDPSILNIEDKQRIAWEQYPIERLRSEFENVVLETRTPWTKGDETIRFRGPRIADVLTRHGFDSSESVDFVAYDNFTSEIRIEEIEAFQPIFSSQLIAPARQTTGKRVGARPIRNLRHYRLRNRDQSFWSGRMSNFLPSMCQPATRYGYGLWSPSAQLNEYLCAAAQSRPPLPKPGFRVASLRRFLRPIRTVSRRVRPQP
ncbi:MAG: hypothetical protein R3D70_24240 [Rhizobiaceae bacterium]